MLWFTPLISLIYTATWSIFTNLTPFIQFSTVNSLQSIQDNHFKHLILAFIHQSHTLPTYLSWSETNLLTMTLKSLCDQPQSISWTSPHQFSSFAQSCQILCNSMDCSTPSFPVHHRLPELTQTHVQRVTDAIRTSYHLSSASPPAINLFQSQFFTSGDQSIGVSASASVLPMNILNWFPLGWTGWISF